MQLPLHLWLPRAVVWLGVLAVLFLMVVWFMAPSPPEELLWNAGGIWAFARVGQFLLMTRGAQAALIWIGGTGQAIERE
ncbi:hypothetical protein CNY89_17160 [Amaricoccus sp. HAR-UPW-R2A-40]|nr:hypothetical protein CNY89_17160 [Amaricoccus sp. HAR-UPW-R2A-40]